MKEAKKCSISGVAFTMDADAYEALETYLESLKTTYKDTADGAEIVADIEARIAELILSAQDNTRIVEKPLILNIIRQMGSAEDISRESVDRDLHCDTPRIPAGSTATRKTPSWAASAPESANISTSTPCGCASGCFCPCCSPASGGFPSCTGSARCSATCSASS